MLRSTVGSMLARLSLAKVRLCSWDMLEAGGVLGGAGELVLEGKSKGFPPEEEW